jgi:hypothetical protein
VYHEEKKMKRGVWVGVDVGSRELVVAVEQVRPWILQADVCNRLEDHVAGDSKLISPRQLLRVAEV